MNEPQLIKEEKVIRCATIEQAFSTVRQITNYEKRVKEVRIVRAVFNPGYTLQIITSD